MISAISGQTVDVVEVGDWIEGVEVTDEQVFVGTRGGIYVAPLRWEAPANPQPVAPDPADDEPYEPTCWFGFCF